MKSVTVRLPAALYRRFARSARKQKVSLNALVERSLESSLAVDEDRALYDAFGRFGQETAATDVAFAESAQRETVTQQAPAKAR